MTGSQGFSLLVLAKERSNGKNDSGNPESMKDAILSSKAVQETLTPSQ